MNPPQKSFDLVSELMTVCVETFVSALCLALFLKQVY